MTARPRLTVDLEALAANYRRLCDLAPTAEIAAVVKADGYGLGLAPVARTLAASGARTFFVADAEEAAALRAILPAATIYVLAGFAPGTEPVFADPGIRPVLNTQAQVVAFAAGDRRPAAVQVDSGMTRLGVPLAALDGLDAALARIDLQLVISHLACADVEASDVNARQRRQFEAARQRVPAAAASLANSAGLFLGKAYHYDLCRPGIALYGGNPRPGGPNPMQAVVELDAQVLQVLHVEAAAQVGYGATYTAPAGARIATLAIGYADGLLRCTSNVATALAEDVEVPFAGRVSMDLLGLDVSALRAAAVREGTRIKVIWGPDGIDRLAAAAGTIPYEVLVRLGPRVERHYLGAPT